MALSTKEATDKIIAYLGKLNEMELGRISSAIKATRQSRKDKLNGASELQFDTGGQVIDTTKRIFKQP